MVFCKSGYHGGNLSSKAHITTVADAINYFVHLWSIVIDELLHNKSKRIDLTTNGCFELQMF